MYWEVSLPFLHNLISFINFYNNDEHVVTPLRQVAGVPRLGHHHILPILFQFFIYQSLFHPVLCILIYWEHQKISHWTEGTTQWRTQEFFSGGSTNSFEDRGQRERGSGDGSPLVRGSGGSCNLIQEISFHMVTFSSFLVL